MSHIFGKWQTYLAKFSTVIFHNLAVSELVKLNGDVFLSAVCRQLFLCAQSLVKLTPCVSMIWTLFGLKFIAVFHNETGGNKNHCSLSKGTNVAQK